VSVPQIKVEFDVTNAPTNPTRVWTRVDNYAGVDPDNGEAIGGRVRSASWVRAGRNLETERAQGGSATIVFDNRDRIFDRDYTSSPLYPALQRSFWFRISLIYGATTYVRWTGVKQSFNKQRPSFGRDRIATLTGSDAMKVLELFPLGGLDYPAQGIGARISAVLADVGCTVGAIDPGKTTLVVPAVTYPETDTTSALSHLQQVEQDERGLLFATETGAIDFQDRTYRSLLAAAGASATLGETDGTLRYVEADFADENDYLWNTVAVTPPSGVIQIALDSSSIEDNFARRLDQSMLVDSNAEALSNAQWYAQRYSAPAERIGQVEVLGGRDPSTWPTILGAQNSDLFDWTGGGNTQGVFLERVSETWEPGKPLGVTWDLSPGERDYLWQLGVPGQSELGVTTRLS
jgi:hypothetical protein